jgi:hypothetical protein
MQKKYKYTSPYRLVGAIKGGQAMKDTEIRNLIKLAEINGIYTVKGLKAFYDRMKQEGETLGETLARHTKEVLGLE